MDYCNNYGEAPDCLGTPDPRYTMRFDDIGKEPIEWCAACGPLEHKMAKMLMKILATPEGLAHAERLIAEQEEENRRRSN